ncbi:MAG: oligosaccharide flippase family protein [Brumimicrobium sp.]|nr:oligosaccharide flippase family protein [Brumimicrobium sp.]
MGIIRSQSIITTIISYAGVIIGFITSAVLMPLLFDPSQVGLVKLIIAVTGIFSTIFSLGVFQMFYRYYPIYKNERNMLSALFFYALRLTVIGILLALPFYLLLSNQLFNLEKETAGIDKSILFVWIVFLAICARLFYNAIFGFIRMSGKVAIDAYIQNLYLKGGMLLLICLFYLGVISYSFYIYSLLFLYMIFPFILLIYLKMQGSLPRYSRGMTFGKQERRELRKISIFGTLTSVGGSLYLYLDTLMVNEYLGEAEVGIYGTMFLFGVIISIPTRGVRSVAQSVISHSINENDMDNVLKVYRKSSASLLVVGGLIFIGVWINLYSVYGYLPKEYAGTEYVVLFIGLAQLVDMTFGVNFEIINSSRMYRLNTYFIFLSILIAIGANLLLIPAYGLNGAALATFIAYFIMNFSVMLAVYKIFKIHPFTLKTVITYILIAACVLLIDSLPNTENYILNLIIKSGLAIILYLPLVYFLNLSEDINDVINKVFKKIIPGRNH